MTRRWLLILTTLALLTAACGDDSTPVETGSEDIGSDDAESTDDAEPNDVDAATDVDESDTDSGGCPAQGFEGSVSRTAQGDHVDAAFDTDTVWTAGVVATRLSEGSHYTLYAADHEYLGDPREFATVTAAPGATAVTFSFGLAAGYTAGQSFDADDDGVTMVVIIDSGGGASSSSMGAVGTVTPIAWTDDWVCFDFDYTDDSQTASGRISAPIVAGF